LALGTALPVGSSTLPLILPVIVICANTGFDDALASSAQTRIRTRFQCVCIDVSFDWTDPLSAAIVKHNRESVKKNFSDRVIDISGLYPNGAKDRVVPIFV
jgi:hypothetical protein